MISMRRPIRFALLLALCLLPIGCAGGGSGGSSSATPENTPNTDATPANTRDNATPEAKPTSEATPTPESEPTPEPTDETFVRVVDYIPDLEVDLRYALDDNFMGKAVYDFTNAWLRYGTVKKLASAQAALKEQGYRLKIWDAFRPPAAQFVMWEVYPHSGFVANPNKGFSNHSRGNTVDVTLITLDGAEVVMPTAFDDFSEKADRDYSDVSPEGGANALLLEQTMETAGFKPYFGEWWHFADCTSYEVEQNFVPTE